MKGMRNLYEHLGYWHNRFGRQVHVSFERRLAVHGVTVSQWCLMITLYSGRIDTVREVAKVLKLDAGAVTRLGDRLEAKGFLLRLPVKKDMRSVRYVLTDMGVFLVTKLAEEADANDAEFYGILSDEEILVYQKILEKLLSSVGTSVVEFCKDFCEKPQIKRSNQ